MRTIERTSKFKKDYKRELKGRHKTNLQLDLINLVTLLANDEELDSRYCDHALSNNWKGYRDCHLKPDLIVIYRKIGDYIIQLVRMGSRSNLGF